MNWYYPELLFLCTMCGISGIYNGRVLADKNQFVHSSLSKLKHRGPDCQEVYQDKHAILGHARLSIIDVDERANQPMISSCGNYVLAFNGEIYNYGELKNDLLKLDVEFKTSSDTEVLLYGLIKFGADYIQKLDGFFAFAFFQKDSKELLVARDRLGIKPLLYAQHKDEFYFASDLSAIMEYDLEKKVDTQSLANLLQYSYIPSPRTILTQVSKLEPGCYLKVNQKGIEKTAYFKLSNQENQDISFQEASDKLKFYLEGSVANRLVADVPLGTFLSGGFDSSIITGIASQFKNDLNTFSIGFKDNPYFDESEAALKTAKEFGTYHHAIQISKNELQNEIESILESFDEPFGDSSAIAVYFLAKETKKHVTVALSGDGADELFAGYNKHKAFYKAYTGSNLALKMANPFSKIVSPNNTSKLGNVSRKISKFNQLLKTKSDEKYDFLASFNAPAKVNSLLKFNTAEYSSRVVQNTNDFLLEDQRFILPNDMLKKVDLMSMRHSLEVRTPFLDHHVVNFVNTLPEDFKINEFGQKILLKDAFKDMLPKHLFGLPKKGFEVPLTAWLEEVIGAYFNSKIFDKDYIEKQNLFHFSEIEKLKTQEFISNSANSSLIWSLLVFQYWYNKLLFNA